MKKIIALGLLSSLLLVGCSEEQEKNDGNTQVKESSTVSDEKKSLSNWSDYIKELASNEDGKSDKFYSLEKTEKDFEVTKEDLASFEKEIVADYKSGTYLKELDNNERMLTNIFKAIKVEENSTGEMKEFAFDYYQNLKYVYRGVDSPESESVVANENQMNKSLSKLGL